MDITFIAFVIYAVGTLVFMWFTLKRFSTLETKVDDLDVNELWGLYSEVENDCLFLKERFGLMCKEIMELQKRLKGLKTKPVKKGKK